MLKLTLLYAKFLLIPKCNLYSLRCLANMMNSKRVHQKFANVNVRYAYDFILFCSLNFYCISQNQPFLIEKTTAGKPG